MLVSVVQWSESAICIHIAPYPLPLEPPSHPPYPTPLGCRKAPSWSPCAVLLLPTSTSQIYCRMLFYWSFSDVSLITRLGLWAFRRKITEIKCRFHHVISRVHTINMIYDCWCWPWSLGWREFVRFLQYKVTPILYSSEFSLGESHYAQHTFKEWELILPFQ